MLNVILIAVGIFGLLGMIILCIYMTWREEKEFAVENVSDINYNPDTEILTFKGGRTGKEYKAIGSGTVWHHVSGKRCDVLFEERLSDIWHYWKCNEKQKGK